MKKLFASAFILFSLCLASCSAPMQTAQNRQNNLGSSFSSGITINIDRFTAEGNIKRNGESEWEVEFTSPNTLSGVSFVFSQGNVEASYQGLKFSVPKSALPVKSMLVNLIAAVDENAKSDELRGKEKEGIFEIEGSLDGGDYILSLDSNGNIKSFDMPNNLLEIDFSDVRIDSPPPTTPTEIQTENNSQATD